MDPSINNYSVENKTISDRNWNEILCEFRDANIYQTYAYTSARYGDKCLRHLIVRKDKKIVAASQVLIKTIPILQAGVAFVRWGPMWKRFGEDGNINDFLFVIKLMKNEYVKKRNLCLRIIPNEVETFDNSEGKILEESGFEKRNTSYRTIYLPLEFSLDDIRKMMTKSWRKNLKKAEGQNIDIIEGSDQNLFKDVVSLYKETVSRKGFQPGINIDDYPLIQKRLPENLKMKIMICQLEGKPIACLVGSSIGEVGIELIAATGNEALHTGASYLLRWKMIEYLKDSGCKYYNLNGINPLKNPGGYQFKSGLAGKAGMDLKFIGEFQCEGSFVSSLLLKNGEFFKEKYKKLRK